MSNDALNQLMHEVCVYVFLYVFLHYFSYVTPKQMNWFPETQKLKVNPRTVSIRTKIRSTVVLKMAIVLFFQYIKQGTGFCFDPIHAVLLQLTGLFCNYCTFEIRPSLNGFVEYLNYFNCSETAKDSLKINRIAQQTFLPEGSEI